ncbi:MAG: FAD-binding oxidoreductase [Chloroflexi bacterium]|nr:FAD-binding oxidoreductase [Chloroflexota bacterium]
MSRNDLRNVIGSVLDKEGILPFEENTGYAIGEKSPQIVAFPKTVEEVSKLLSLSTQEGVAVIPRGGGTQMGLGNIPRRVDMVVGLSRLSRVLEHHAADLTVKTEAGITLGELDSALAPARQFLPLDPMLPESATIGGILATNASGPLCLRYGTARDMLLGIKVVSASGVVTKAGGRVVKNVAGYDMNKLYIGSLGTLGVIVEATFKVAPIPRVKATLYATFESIEKASDYAHRILHSVFRPLALECLAGSTTESIGLKLGIDIVQKGIAVAALFGGVPSVVERELQESQDICQRTGAVSFVTLRGEANDNIWGEIRGLGRDDKESPRLVTMANVLPSDAFQLVGTTQALGEELGLTTGVVAAPGSGTVRGFWEIRRPENMDMLASLIMKLRGLAVDLKGSLVVESCPTSLKEKLDVWGAEGADLAIMRRIKEQFDPKGILNPGRFVGGI